MRGILFAGFLVFASLVGNGQENTIISKSEFKLLIDSINYEYLKYLFQDNKPNIAAEFNKLRKDDVSYSQIQAFLSKKKVDKVYSDIATEINMLKQSYSKDNSTLKNLLVSEIFENQSLFEFNKAHNKRLTNTNYMKFKEALIISVKCKLDNSVYTKSDVMEETPIVVQAAPKEQQETKSPRTPWVSYLLTGVISFFAGSLLTMALRKKLLEMRKNQTIVNSDSGLLTNDNTLNQSLQYKVREIQKLREDNELLRKQLETDRETAERASMAPPIQPDEVDFAKIDITPGRQTEYGTLYFPNPISDGFFLADNGRNAFTEGASIYKFTLTSPFEASFEYCEDPSSVKIALNNRNELLLSVAEEANAYNPSASKIIADPPGKATLEGSIWRVTQKAKIKYV